MSSLSSGTLVLVDDADRLRDVFVFPADVELHLAPGHRVSQTELRLEEIVLLVVLVAEEFDEVQADTSEHLLRGLVHLAFDAQVLQEALGEVFVHDGEGKARTRREHGYLFFFPTGGRFCERKSTSSWVTCPDWIASELAKATSAVWKGVKAFEKLGMRDTLRWQILAKVAKSAICF